MSPARACARPVDSRVRRHLSRLREIDFVSKKRKFEKPDKMELLWRKILRAGCLQCGCKIPNGHYAGCPVLAWATKTTPAIYFVSE